MPRIATKNQKTLRKSHPFSLMDTIKSAWHGVYGSKRIYWIITAIILVEVCAITLIKYKLPLLGLAPWLSCFLLFTVTSLYFILTLLLGLGMIYLGLMRSERLHIEFGMIARVFRLKMLWRMICLDILMAAICLPLTIVIYLATHIFIYLPNLQFVVAFEIFRFIVFSIALMGLIFLMVRLYFTKALLVAQPDMKPLAVIETSFQYTRTHFWKLLGLLLTNILVIFVSAIPFGIGLLWSIPFCFINYAIAYKKIIR